MKKILTLLISFITLSAYAQIQGTEWGQNVNTVKESRTNDLILDQNNGRVHILGEMTELLGYETTIGYYFIDDKLFQIAYIFAEEYSYENLYIDQYNEVKKVLTEKYGAPKTSFDPWTNDLYKDDPSQYGFAISLGHHRKISTWNTGEMSVINSLDGQNYEINHSVYYNHNQLTEEFETYNSEKNISDF